MLIEQVAKTQFIQADHEWKQELRHLFGRRAKQIVFTQKRRGTAGSLLRELYEARMSRFAEWDAAAAPSSTVPVKLTDGFTPKSKGAEA